MLPHFLTPAPSVRQSRALFHTPTVPSATSSMCYFFSRKKIIAVFHIHLYSLYGYSYIYYIYIYTWLYTRISSTNVVFIKHFFPLRTHAQYITNLETLRIIIIINNNFFPISIYIYHLPMILLYYNILYRYTYYTHIQIERD